MPKLAWKVDDAVEFIALFVALDDMLDGNPEAHAVLERMGRLIRLENANMGLLYRRLAAHCNHDPERMRRVTEVYRDEGWLGDVEGY